MLRWILNKSWRQHPTKQQLYGLLPTITKTIQVRRTRHAGYCWRSWDELITDVIQWTPSHGWAKAEQPARTYIHRLFEDTGCSPEDLPKAMNDRERWREKVRHERCDETIAIYMWKLITQTLKKKKLACKVFTEKKNMYIYFFVSVQTNKGC